MKKNIGTRSSGFTLVELLVVITILAVISVVAYTSFG
jgi:prepilin-type N-terminal cleavage/methylation domain-containing protein